MDGNGDGDGEDERGGGESGASAILIALSTKGVVGRFESGWWWCRFESEPGIILRNSKGLFSNSVQDGVSPGERRKMLTPRSG